MLHHREEHDDKLGHGIGTLQTEWCDLIRRFLIASAHLLRQENRCVEAGVEVEEWDVRCNSQAKQELLEWPGDCHDRYKEFQELRAVCLDVDEKMRLWIDFQVNPLVPEWR